MSLNSFLESALEMTTPVGQRVRVWSNWRIRRVGLGARLHILNILLPVQDQSEQCA
jgi:hypothetical protein